ERRHPTAARVAAAWAAQEERRVLVDSSYTTAVLDRLGVRFAAPTPRWWSAALTWAAEAGYLPPVGPTPPTRDDIRDDVSDGADHDTRDDVRDGAGHDPRDDIREGRTNP
ncbi:hypothetical protein, partial [Kitasatospora sp. MY 5-36]|uniref:hypothetical protein n=1 Tax=Kitasatospora sp. MY 5-36 TaxID=1678027 RepID=UPI0006714982